MSDDIRIDDHSKEFLDALSGAITKALHGIGAHVEGEAKELLTTREYPHADGTKRPYMDTGNLRNSINYQVKEDEQAVYVGTNVEYAKYIHEGTSTIKPNRFLKDAVVMNQDQIKEYFENEIREIT